MDLSEEHEVNQIKKQIRQVLKQKGYKDVEMTWGQVMDDHWVTLKGPGVFLDVCELYYYKDAFKSMLREVERKL